MPLTATQLRAALKRNLKNDATFSDPDDLNLYLTLGQQRMVLESPHSIGVAFSTISLVASDRIKALSALFHRMVAVWHPTFNRKLEFVPYEQWVNEVESLSVIPSGPPTRYTISVSGDVNNTWNIHFDRIADASYTINYWFQYMPADISGSAVPTVAVIGFSELLLWAATMIARENFDPDGAREAERHYLAGMEQFRNHHPAGPDWNVVTPYPGEYRPRFVLDPSRYQW